jgi:hypothetical protein
LTIREYRRESDFLIGVSVHERCPETAKVELRECAIRTIKIVYEALQVEAA